MKTLLLSLLASTMFAQVFTLNVSTIRSEPIYRTVTKRVPYQECYETQSNGQNTVGTILGGAAGGVLGHQVGKGKGNTAATIGGAVFGAMLGNKYIANSPRTQQKCVTRYTTSQEERLMGYKNTGLVENIQVYKITRRPVNSFRVKLISD